VASRPSAPVEPSLGPKRRTIGVFIFAAFIWKIIAVEPQSVTESKRWIGRIVVGTIGVEMAGTLVQILTGSLSH
jgi:hypothetical protein